MRKVFQTLTFLMVPGTILFSGCASIVSKSSYPVYFHIDPVGTNISITDKKGKEVYKGKSPAKVSLKSGSGYFAKAEYQVKLSSPGFAEKIVPIHFKLNGWYFGNIIFGGVIGLLIVDPATGAMWKIEDPVVDETLVKESASTTPAPTLNIVDIRDISDDLKSKLVRVR